MWLTYVAWSVTHYWVEGLWLKPQWGQVVHTNPKVHPVSCRMGTTSLSQGMALTPHVALSLVELYL